MKEIGTVIGAVIGTETEKRRCPWCGSEDLYVRYHDEEWGVPVKDERKLFEFIVLEGAQAGLSWITILRRRENYRAAFADFDVQAVAGFDESDVTRLLNDSGIIRNRAKIESTVKNARAFLRVAEEYGTFGSYLWGFVDGKPIVNRWAEGNQIPATTPLAEKISKDMKKKGFSFFGPTVCYAHMQATGMVNDHLTSCFRYKELAGTARTPTRRRRGDSVVRNE
ncbi:MAG: DNA-3-methyladenine glycosylase I [Synergistaceae bacterium]|jgi:DNA-3-methyladenine glycosylase I|nr:DNA-3-methyladenine glycosylase I [Synergistaceae bacterium]